MHFERNGKTATKKQEGFEEAEERNKNERQRIDLALSGDICIPLAVAYARARALCYSTFVSSEEDSVIPLLPGNRVRIPSMFSYLWAKEMSYFFKVDII